jgi:hypothetical protein
VNAASHLLFALLGSGLGAGAGTPACLSPREVAKAPVASRPADAAGEASFLPILGEAFQGTLLGVDREGVAQLRVGKESRRQRVDELREIRFGDVEPAAEPPPRLLSLRSGLVWPGEFVGGEGRSFVFKLAGAMRVQVPVRYLRGFRLCDKVAEADQGFAEALAGKLPSQDLVFVWQEDKLKRLPCRIDGATDAELRIEWGGQVRSLPHGRVYGVVFGEGSGAEPVRSPQSPRVWVRVEQGFDLRGVLVEVTAQAVTVLLDEGVRIPLPLREVAWLKLQSPRFSYLSDLKPTAVEQTPAFHRTWPPRFDGSLQGGPLRLGGRVYERGIAATPRTRITYALDRKQERFAALIGIGDEVAQGGNAVFRVLGDGRELFVAESVLGGSPPRAVLVDVSGIDKLTLEVDFGEALDLGDHCVWADARVVSAAAR